MLFFARRFCNKFFNYIGLTNLKIIRNAGLILAKDFLASSGLVELLHKHLTDNRDPFRIHYLGSEIVLGIILKILDGEIRLYHQKNRIDRSFYEQVYTFLSSPHFTTLRYFFGRNPGEYKALQEITFEWTMQDLMRRIKEKKLKRITLDIDQTARSIYGRQEKAKKGYNPNGKGDKLFQTEIWTIRELKTILRIELRDGSDHCVKDFLKKLKEIIPRLTALGVAITVVCDSGYENTEVFGYLGSKNVNFLFAVKQHEPVKVRGKNAKNKTVIKNVTREKTVLKEAKSKPVEFGGYIYTFREIFVQLKIIMDQDGQLYFKDIESNEFTNVFVTNLEMNKETVYEFYKKHAQVETIIEELKNDFGMGLSHNHSFNFNQSMAQIVALAYNTKNMLIQQKFLSKNSNAIMKLSTFQRNFIHIPGILVNESGKKVLKLTHEGFSILNPFFLDFGYKFAS